jgi:hypothetical protein
VEKRQGKTKKKIEKRKKRGESQHFPRDQLEQQTSRHMEKSYISSDNYIIFQAYKKKWVS